MHFTKLLFASRGPRSTPADIKRLMAYAPAMNSEFIVSYFGTLSRETSIDVMKEMLGKNMRQNLQMVVQIATAYSDQIGAESLMEMFESFKLYEGLFYYLGAIVNNSTVSEADVFGFVLLCLWFRVCFRVFVGVLFSVLM